MASRSFRPDRLDVAAFAKAEGTLEGELAQTDLPRVAEALLPDAQGRRAPVRWRASGRLQRPRVGATETWLHLSGHTQGRMVCQRCLEPMTVDLPFERDFRFAPDEATAAEWDEDSEEDVLVTTTALNLHTLVEDEVLLGLPWVPRHTECAGIATAARSEDSDPPGAGLPDNPANPPGQPADDEPPRPHPFAALQRLKGPGH